MTWEWQIGDPVDDANGGTMDAMNWGHGSDEDDEDYDRGSNVGYGGYGGYRQELSPKETNRIILGNIRDGFKRKLEKARGEKNDDYRIKYYGEALEYAQRYFEESKRRGMTVKGMPDKNHVLSKSDVDWISKKHYDEYFKFHILSTDQTENLENLLKKSGNGDRIRRNEETHRQNSIEYARKSAINHATYLNKDYFERIEKANEYVLKNKPSKAIKEYKNAISDYEKFFESEYREEGMIQKMPDKSLTDDAIDNIMTIYVNCHPLLKSSKGNEKINMEIIDLLDGEWDERLREADREVDKILEQRNLERQQRKQNVEDLAVDMIVGARIVGDSIMKRFRK